MKIILGSLLVKFSFSMKRIIGKITWKTKKVDNNYKQTKNNNSGFKFASNYFRESSSGLTVYMSSHEFTVFLWIEKDGYAMQ